MIVRRSSPAGVAPLFMRIEWLLLLAALVVAGWVYPLRLQDAWLQGLSGWLTARGAFGAWLWRVIEPFVAFEYSPLVIRGVLMAPLMLGFAALVSGRRLVAPGADKTAATPWIRLSILAFVGWTLLSGFWSPTPGIARDAAVWSAVFGGFFYFLFLRGVSDRERRQLAIALLIVGSGVLAILFLEALPIFRSRAVPGQPPSVNWIYSVLYRFTDSERNLFGSLIGHNTAAASFTMLTCFPALALLLGVRSKLGRWLCGVYLAAAIFGVVLLQSRSIWVLGPILGFLALRSAFRQSGIKAGRWAVTLLLAAFTFSLATQTINRPWNPFYSQSLSLRDRLHDLTPHGLELEARLRLAIVGATMIADHPLFGYGLNSFQYVYPKRQGEYFNAHPESPLNQTINRSNFAHDEYLQTLIEEGLVGLGLLLWIVREIVRRGWALRREAGGADRLLREAFGWSSLGLALHALVDFPFHVPQLLLPGMLCMAAWASDRIGSGAAAAEAPVPLIEGSGFRPLVFARLLGTLLLFAAIPLACSWMFVSLQGDFIFNEGAAYLTAARLFEKDGDYPFQRAEDLLNGAKARFVHAGHLIPNDFQVPAKMVEVYWETGKIFRARAEREAAPGAAFDASKSAEDRERGIQEQNQALLWTATTLKGLDYHYVYYLASRAEYELAQLESVGARLQRIQGKSAGEAENPASRAPMEEHLRRQINLLQMTLFYCPVFGEALYDLDIAASSLPGADHAKIVALRRRILLKNPDVFDRHYVFLADDYKRMGYYERARRLWDQILEVDPANARWRGEAIDCRLLTGDVAEARAMLDKFKADDIKGYFSSGMMLIDDALKGEWRQGMAQILNFASPVPEIRARMRAMEIEFIHRLPGYAQPVWASRPPQTSQADWDRMVAAQRPEVLLAYFQDPQEAREAFDQRLPMGDAGLDVRFWLSGVRIGLALHDAEFARRNLDEASKVATDPGLLMEVRSRVETAF